MLVLRRWETKAAYPWLRQTTVTSRSGDGIANASIGQPAGITAVKPRELPRRIQLSNFGNLCSVLLTRMLSFSQVHLVRGLKVVDSPLE